MRLKVNEYNKEVTVKCKPVNTKEKYEYVGV